MKPSRLREGHGGYTVTEARTLCGHGIFIGNCATEGRAIERKNASHAGLHFLLSSKIHSIISEHRCSRLLFSTLN